MRSLICLFFSVLTVFGENPYNGIVERNGFELTAENPPQVLLLPTLPLADDYLTGITRKDKIYTAYMVIKDKTQNKFLGLREGEKKDEVEAMKITKDTVFISYNGPLHELTFKQNSFPSIVTNVATKSNTKDKRERGRSSSSSQRAVKAPSRPSAPQVVTVPSRRPQIDPRLLNSSGNSDERRRRYDEWRKSRERSK